MPKYTNKDVFTLSSISVILCECFYYLVTIFVDTFVISRILAITNYEIYHIGILYISIYAVRFLFSWCLNYLLKKIKLNYFVTIGALVMMAIVLSVYFLDDASLINFLPLLGLAYSVGSASYWTGQTNLATVAVSSRYQVRFFTVKRTAVVAVKALAPFVLGSAISGVGESGFKIVAILMAVFTVLLFICSFFVKQNKKFTMTFKFFPFVKKVIKERKQYPLLTNIYCAGFYHAFVISLFGAVFTYLIAKNFQSDFYLGTIKTIVTAVSLLGMFSFLKTYRKRHAFWYTFVPMVLIPLATIIMMFFLNSYTVIIAFAVYNILTVNLTSLVDMRRAGIIRLLDMHEHILEHNALFEVILDIGRLIGFGIFLLVGILNSEIALNILIGIILATTVLYCFHLHRIEKLLIEQDKEWKKSHIAVSDSTIPIEVQQEKKEETK